MNSWDKEQNTIVKDILKQQLHDEYAEEKEFSLTIKSYPKANGFPVQESRFKIYSI